MSRRSLAGITIGLLVICVLGWWQGRDTAPQEPATAAPALVPVVKKAVLPAAQSMATTEKLPELGTEAFNVMAKERVAAWMASRNRDAVSLLALWDLTGDESLLREAAEKFPGNPQVCLAMLGVVFEKEGNEADKRKWTDHLIAADPDNPLGYHYKARLAQAAGDRASVIAALETALGKKDRIDYYLRERMVGAKEGLLASGVPLKDAYPLSLAAPMAKVSAEIFGAGKMIGLFKTELATMKAAGLESEFQELAALGLRLAEQQRLTQSPSLITELIAHSLRMKFLKDLDPETEIANSGRSVTEEIAVSTVETENLSKLMKDAGSANQYFQNAPVEVQGQYADRMMMDGEKAALMYLLEERQKAKKP